LFLVTRLIGYWKAVWDHDKESEQWPDPRWFVDPHWDEGERQQVSLYLKGRGRGLEAFCGPSWCRLCDADVGSVELTDGAFDWPEGLIHYVDEHCVRLPPEFLRHVLEGGAQQPAGEDTQARNTDWWAAQKGWDRTHSSPHLTPGKWVFTPWEWAAHRLAMLVIADGAALRCADRAFCGLLGEVANSLRGQGAEALARWLTDGASPVRSDRLLDVRQLTPANQAAFRSALPPALAAYRAKGPEGLDVALWQGYVRLFDNLTDQVAVLQRGGKPRYLPNLGRVPDYEGTRAGPGWGDGP
jgi:hypothetical protein